MPYQVQVGSQVVEFPDSVPQEEAQRILADQFPPTGEDVASALQDPNFIPTREQFDLFKEYNKTKQTDWVNTIAQSVDAAAGMIGSALSQGAQGAAINPLNYIEGAAQGTRQMYGLVAQSENPDSPLFKFKDLLTGTGTPDSQYNQFLEARDFARTSQRLEKGEEGVIVPPELTNPEFVQGVSMIADPSMLLPGIGEMFGAGKLATKAVGKGAQLAGRAVAGAARPLERALTAGERMAAEALSVSPEALRTTAATTGIAGALGIAPELATAAAIPAGVRTTREVGEAIQRAGENLMTQPSRIGPLEAIGAAPGANMRQRMLGVIGQYGGDAAVDAALRGTAGALEGATIGAGLGYLSGGEEGAAAGLGTGAVQGAAGALGARTYEKLSGKAAAEARAGDLGRFIEGLQDPTTKALFENVKAKHGTDAASALMDLEALTKGRFGDVDILYRDSGYFRDTFGSIARGVRSIQGDRPTLVVNVDFLGKGKGDSPLYTLGHELFHALEEADQLAQGANAIKDSIVGRYTTAQDGTVSKLQEGALTDAEIEQRFNEYRDKLGGKMADDLARYDTIDKKANFIASELAAEHFARLISGQKPDALLKGFSGLGRQALDFALTQNASKALSRAAASIEGVFGVKPTDSVLFPDLKQASPQLNAMLRDLMRARRALDEKIVLQGDKGIATLKPSDIGNPAAAKQVVDLGLGERLPDGTVRPFSDEEIAVREQRDTAELRKILETVPGAREVDGEIQGRFSPQQLTAIEQSMAVSGRMKDKIRAVNAAMQNGYSVFVDYGAATRKKKNRATGKETSVYSSGIRLSQREVVPYSFYLSKADNPVVKVIDISKIRGALERMTESDGSIAGLWSNTDGFLSDLAQYFTNLDRKEGARRSSELFGPEKATFLGDFVNSKEKSGAGKFVRDLRLDRIGSIDPRSFRARISEDAIQMSKMRWMPAESIGDTKVTNSEEGYRIVSANKHRLYGPDGKLIGIYDTQTQAERKADATQTRLQPEIDQQQRLQGDEGRQTAEAGGGYRPLDRTQSGPEGRQAVRQAGDVRFMPEGKSQGLAVLDNELTLDLPPRPKVIDIANAFQKLFGKAIEYRKARPQDNARLVNLLVQEIDRAVKLHPEAKGWYDENVKLTMDVMRELDPDIAKPENDFIFKAILAATSDGNKVGPQFQQTWKEYNNWKNTGKISGEFVSGDRIENIQNNLEMLNAMIEGVGWEKTKDFMVQKGTVKELRQALMDVFGWTKKEAQSVGSSELADEVVPFAVVLGPKLGSFFNNLYGDFSSVTMDRWFMRTLGRLTGSQVAPLAAAKLRQMRNNLRDAVSRLTPSQFELLKVSRGDLKGSAIDDTATTIAGRFSKKELREIAKKLDAEGQSALEETRKFANALKKGLNPLVEAPVDGTHRRWIRERIAEVQKELRSRGIDLENADLQAVLWYLEKELYEKLKYRSKSGESDYASAASSLYQSVVGRPSDVYAGGTGRVRAIGGDGRGDVMGGENAVQAPKPAGEVGQRFMPSDSDYMAAVEAGDTGKAQEMVAQAAKAAGYTVGPVFHGSGSRFNQFKRQFLGKAAGGKSAQEAFFFSDSNRTARAYASHAADEGPIKELMRKADAAEQRGDWDAYDKFLAEAENMDFGPEASALREQRRQRSKVYDVFLKGRFLELDAEGKTPAELAQAGDFKEFDGSLTAAIKKAKRRGYDGVVFKNLDDAPNLGDPSNHYAVFNPDQIKLSDPVTRDDSGNVIPLSQRFQQSSADIRYMPETISRDIGSNKDFANPPTDAEAIDALSAEKKAKFGKAARSIKPGTQVAARIDIPAFLRKGKYVVAVHEPDGPSGGPGKVIGYDTVVRLQNPKFVVKPGVQRIYEGKANKFPVATVDGQIMADRSIPSDLEDYVPVGMDPKEHAYFYDKRTDQPVVGGSESVSVGNTVFVKNPVYGNPRQFAFMPSEAMMAAGRSPNDRREAVHLFEQGWKIYGAPYDGAEDPIRLKKVSEIDLYDPENMWAVPPKKLVLSGMRNMPTPDASMPGAYSFQGGFRALPGKEKGKLRIYGPAGNLIGIAASLDQAERMIQKKAGR